MNAAVLPLHPFNDHHLRNATMTTETITPEALATLQSDLERSRTDFKMLALRAGELASAFGILRMAIENEPGTAADLARILEEYTTDLVETARKRAA